MYSIISCSTMNVVILDYTISHPLYHRILSYLILSDLIISYLIISYHILSLTCILNRILHNIQYIHVPSYTIIIFYNFIPLSFSLSINHLLSHHSLDFYQIISNKFMLYALILYHIQSNTNLVNYCIKTVFSIYCGGSLDGHLS